MSDDCWCTPHIHNPPIQPDGCTPGVSIVADPTDGGALLYFTVAVYGQGNIDRAELIISDSLGNFTSQILNPVVLFDDEPYALTNLVNGESYSLNLVLISGPCSLVSAGVTVIPSGLPAPLTITSVDVDATENPSVACFTANVTYGANNGSPVNLIQFLLYDLTQGGLVTLPSTTIINPNSPPKFVTFCNSNSIPPSPPLVIGHEYSLSAIVFNSAGASSTSASYSFKLQEGVPSTPNVVGILSGISGQVVIVLERPETDAVNEYIVTVNNGSPSLSYTYTLDNSSTLPNVVWDYIIITAPNLMLYNVNIVAKNSATDGTSSPAVAKFVAWSMQDANDGLIIFSHDDNNEYFAYSGTVDANGSFNSVATPTAAITPAGSIIPSPLVPASVSGINNGSAAGTVTANYVIADNNVQNGATLLAWISLNLIDIFPQYIAPMNVSGYNVTPNGLGGYGQLLLNSTLYQRFSDGGYDIPVYMAQLKAEDGAIPSSLLLASDSIILQAPLEDPTDIVLTLTSISSFFTNWDAPSNALAKYPLTYTVDLYLGTTPSAGQSVYTQENIATAYWAADATIDVNTDYIAVITATTPPILSTNGEAPALRSKRVVKRAVKQVSKSFSKLKASAVDLPNFFTSDGQSNVDMLLGNYLNGVDNLMLDPSCSSISANKVVQSTVTFTPALTQPSGGIVGTYEIYDLFAETSAATITAVEGQENYSSTVNLLAKFNPTTQTYYVSISVVSNGTINDELASSYPQVLTAQVGQAPSINKTNWSYTPNAGIVPGGLLIVNVNYFNEPNIFTAALVMPDTGSTSTQSNVLVYPDPAPALNGGYQALIFNITYDPLTVSILGQDVLAFQLTAVSQAGYDIFQSAAFNIAFC